LSGLFSNLRIQTVSFFNENTAKPIEEFNKYRAPEAVAKLVSVDSGSFKIEFTGPFCQACGFHDYFDDFRIFLEEIGPQAEIMQIEETNSGAIVTFQITN
jgi:hypothetical protein